jgi:hypothetical protein
MKTRRKVLLSVGFLIAAFGLVLLGSSILNAFDPRKPHGWSEIIWFGIIGAALVATGVSLCYEKDAA